jgi:hypothetical protein
LERRVVRGVAAMRQRRHKRVRKAVRFYKVCFQFREPFKARPLAPSLLAALR